MTFQPAYDYVCSQIEKYNVVHVKLKRLLELCGVRNFGRMDVDNSNGAKMVRYLTERGIRMEFYTFARVLGGGHMRVKNKEFAGGAVYEVSMA